jgi:hypothetical protein
MKKQSAKFQIPRTSMRHLMRKKGYHKYQPTFINELNDHDMDMWQQTCAALLHTFPTLASHHNIMFTDECAVYLSTRSKMLLSGLNKVHISLNKQQSIHLML